MHGGRPEVRNTFTGCCHDNLEWAVFLFSRSKLEATAERREEERVRNRRQPYRIPLIPFSPLLAKSLDIGPEAEGPDVHTLDRAPSAKGQ